MKDEWLSVVTGIMGLVDLGIHIAFQLSCKAVFFTKVQQFITDVL